MARKRLEKTEMTNVEYRKGDAASLPVDSGAFDIVFLVTVLGEVPDRAACLREIRRVLRGDGLLSLTEQVGDPHFIAMPEILSLAQAAGFRCCAKYGIRWNYTVNFRQCP